MSAACFADGSFVSAMPFRRMRSIETLLRLADASNASTTMPSIEFRWPTRVPHAVHTLWRYDGKQWTSWGGPKPDATKKGTPPSYEDRLAVLSDEPDNVPAFDGSRATFSQVGCWMTCHNSMRGMPRDVPRKSIDPHPYWGAKGRRVGDRPDTG